MSTAGPIQVAVLLVGLPGFYEGLLRREFSADSGITVRHLAETSDSDAPPLEEDSIIVVGTSAASLRRATALVNRGSRILGTVAVTDDEPRGDVYLVSPAGVNVSRHELAQVIRDVVIAGLLSRREHGPFHSDSLGATHEHVRKLDKR